MHFICFESSKFHEESPNDKRPKIVQNMTSETYCIIRLNDLKFFFKLNFLLDKTFVGFHLYVVKSI